MSEPNLTREAPDDELADLPENVKLNEGEVVLYKYLCSIRFFCVLKIIVCALFIWPPCALFLELGVFYENMLRNFYYRFVGIDILRGYEFYPRGILRDK